MTVSSELKKLMEKYFGDRGLFLLAGELQSLEITDLDKATNEEKYELIDALILDLFSKTTSDTKLRFVRLKLNNCCEV